MVTMDLVKNLREITGIGIGDCKKALEATNGDIEAAIKFLREKGMASAAKKADREVKEGACGLVTKGDSTYVLKLACETDFVAKNEKFHEIFTLVLNNLVDQNIDSLEKAREASASIIAEKIAVIGENMSIAGFEKLTPKNGVVATYLHTQYTPFIARKLSAVVIESDCAKKEELLEMGKKVCMHVTAMKPEFVSSSDVSDAFKESEREIYLAQMKDSGKPADILAKIIDGKLQKTISDKTLLEQVFCIDPSVKVSEFVAKTEKELSSKIEITKFSFLEI